MIDEVLKNINEKYYGILRVLKKMNSIREIKSKIRDLIYELKDQSVSQGLCRMQIIYGVILTESMTRIPAIQGKLYYGIDQKYSCIGYFGTDHYLKDYEIELIKSDIIPIVNEVFNSAKYIGLNLGDDKMCCAPYLCLADIKIDNNPEGQDL